MHVHPETDTVQGVSCSRYIQLMRVRESAAFDYRITNPRQPEGPSTDIHYG
jgi:hypothetical protein